MTREAVEREPKHHLRRALRPPALALDDFKPFQKTADIEQHTREFRANGLQRRIHAALGGEHRIAEGAGARAGRALALRDRGNPVRRHARREAGAGEIGAQALARLKLRGADHALAVRTAALGEPGKRAFGFVDKPFFMPHDAAVLHQERIAHREQPRKMRLPRRGQGQHGAFASKNVGTHQFSNPPRRNRQALPADFDRHTVFANPAIARASRL